ncbi:phage tail tape measure protein [Methylophilus sp. YYY-1]|uniref:phage tail tape measure protein n=1 Tax=Methylophilus sp. YYY-1 TaxID=2682087 RepID=UPI0023B25B80|nr:phage tail tape measure protein [Methylophilus sp. YYY-1]MDF0377699.1 tail tape measure protein [Methylophilus sp. YYY-1]
MSANSNLGVTLALRLLDKLSQPLNRALSMAKRDMDAVEKSGNALSRLSMSTLVGGINQVTRAAAAAERGLKAVQTAGRVAAGISAGVYVASRPIERTMSYDLRLANMSNTAFSSLDKTGRQAGMRQLNQAIIKAVRAGGGDRDQAAETLDTLIASGAFSPQSAMKILPQLQKAATAANTNPTDLANIGIRGMQTFGIKPDQMGDVIDMAIMAGQLGGFELKDMAKWLPQQMAAAKLSGMTGMGGMQKLLAYNQAAVITAGTKDEAGNNLVNLLAKINSQDTAKDAQKLGINLPGTLAAAQAKGMNSLDAFVGIVDSITKRDSKFQALKKQAAASKGDTQQQAFAAQADILEGSAIGKIVQDRQALMALVGIMNNREYLKNIEDNIDPSTGKSKGSAARNFDLISSTPSYQTARLANEKAFAEQDGFGGISKVIGDVSSKLADYAQHYPGLTAAITVAATALTALAASAGAAGLAGMLTGKGAGVVAGAAGAATGMRVTAALAGGMPLGQFLAAGGAGGAALAGGGLLAAGAAGYGVGSLLNKGIGWSIGKMTDGNANSLGSLIYQLTHKEQAPIKVTVDVKNGNIVAAVNQENSRSARRY